MSNPETYSLHPNQKLEKWEVIHALAVLVLYQNGGHDIKFTTETNKYVGWQGTMKPSY